MSVSERPIDRSLTEVLPLSEGELGELSHRASSILGGGSVDATQVRHYVGQLAQRTPTLLWFSTRTRDELERYAAQADTHQSAATVAKRGTDTATRTWLRGAVATYLALQDLFAGGWPGR